MRTSLHDGGERSAGQPDPLERIANALEQLISLMQPRPREAPPVPVISEADRAAARKVARRMGLVVKGGSR